MQEDQPWPEGQSATEAAAYIAELCGHLSVMAHRQGLDTLVYLLDMARLEAQQVTGQPSETVSSAG
jgi:hypothetical protein